MATVEYNGCTLQYRIGYFHHFCAGVQIYDVGMNGGELWRRDPSEQIKIYRGLLNELRNLVLNGPAIKVTYPNRNRMLWYSGTSTSPVYRMFTLMGCGTGVPFRNYETNNWVRTFQLLAHGRINPRPLSHPSWRKECPVK